MRDARAGVCEGERAGRRSVCLSVCPWSHNPGCGNHSQPRHLRGAHARGAGSAGVRVRGVCARRGSARCLLPALANFLAHPEPSLPPVAATGGPQRGGRPGDRLREGDAGGTYRAAGGPWRPRERSRRRGAAALPCLARRGRRPRLPPSLVGAQAAREGRGVDAAAAAPGSRSRPARGGRGLRALRAPRPPATPRGLITFASGPLGGASCASPPLGALAERGNSFPLTSSSEMQKISDFDR